MEKHTKLLQKQLQPMANVNTYQALQYTYQHNIHFCRHGHDITEGNICSHDIKEGNICGHDIKEGNIWS